MNPFRDSFTYPKNPPNIVPWSLACTPNQAMLIIQLVVLGEVDVTIAVQARTDKAMVDEVEKAYSDQIGLAREMSESDRERFYASIHRQMLARWERAGHDPKSQPETAPKVLKISEAALKLRDKKK